MSDILQGLFKPSEFVFSDKDLRDVIAEYNGLDRNDTDMVMKHEDFVTRRWLRIFSRQFDADRTILRSDLIDELDNIFIERFGAASSDTVKGRLMLGMNHAYYLDPMEGYVNDAMNHLRAHANADDYEGETEIIRNHLYAKSRWVLHRIDDYFPLPLLSKTVVISISESLALMDEGLKEVNDLANISAIRRCSRGAYYAGSISIQTDSMRRSSLL